MKPILISLAVLALAACAETGPRLSAQQCAANWAAVGQADGAEGAAPAKFDEYRAACARSGAALSGADARAWRQGWERGLARFCAAPPAGEVAAARADEYCGERLAAAPPRPRLTARTEEPAYGGYDGDLYDDGYDGPYDDEPFYADSVIVPRIGVGIGVGGGGDVSGGVGVGFGVGILDLGVGFGF